MNDNRSGGEGLQRKLSPLNVWALALGSIIGWGAFVMPANTFLPNAGPLGTLIAMAAGAIIMVVIALNYSYMINHFPVAGGEFTFTNASFGPTCGFLCAWFLGLSYLAIVPLNATALALIGRNLFPNLTQWGYLYSVEGYSIYAGEILLASLRWCFLRYSASGVSAWLASFRLSWRFLWLAVCSCWRLLRCSARMLPLPIWRPLLPQMPPVSLRWAVSLLR